MLGAKHEIAVPKPITIIQILLLLQPRLPILLLLLIFIILSQVNQIEIYIIFTMNENTVIRI